MPQIEATFVVEPYDITVTTDSSNLVVAPTVLDLNIFSAGYSNPAGNNGELQYNNGGILGGVPVAVYTGGNIVFANVTNVKLPGGSNAYFLQTDGTGNITWAPGTVNANTGNGIAVGANTQIQITDGTGNFVSAPGFTFNYVSNTLTVPNAGIFTGNIQSGNANLGNAATANYFIGNLIGELSNGTSNIRIFANSNIAFSVAGNSNVAIITSTGIVSGNGNFTNANIQNLIGNANLTNLLVNSPTLALGQFAASSGNQNFGAIAIGYAAGIVNQGTYGIAVGRDSGGTTQGSNAVAIGTFAGYQLQGANSIAIGTNAGPIMQAANTIALNATGANLAANAYANAFYVKPIRNATTSNVLYYDLATGEITYAAISTSSISNGNSNVNIPSANGNVTVSVAGVANVLTVTSTGIVVVGNVSGNITNSNFANYAGNVTVASQPNITSLGTLTSLAVSSNTISLGNLSTASSNGVAIGANSTATGTGPVAIGRDSSASFTGIAIGYGARGNQSQSIAIGEDAITFSSQTIAIGNGTRTGTGVSSAIAIGQSATANTTNGISIGFQAGTGSTTGANKIAIGYQAGMSSTTSDTIAIGSRAGRSAQAQNTIILNASGANLNASTANTFTVKPIRNLANNYVLMYNATTGEITYDTLQNYTTYVKTISTTVGALANATTIGAGGRAFVTDANTTTFNAVVGGGGANSVPVFSDGTDWKVG